MPAEMTIYPFLSKREAISCNIILVITLIHLPVFIHIPFFFLTMIFGKKSFSMREGDLKKIAIQLR